MEKFYTIEEVSKIANVSVKTVRRHIACGNLPSEKRQNKYFIADSNLQTWLATGKCLEFHSIFDNAETKKHSQGDNVNWIDTRFLLIFVQEQFHFAYKYCISTHLIFYPYAIYHHIQSLSYGRE